MSLPQVETTTSNPMGISNDKSSINYRDLSTEERNSRIYRSVREIDIRHSGYPQNYHHLSDDQRRFISAILDAAYNEFGVQQVDDEIYFVLSDIKDIINDYERGRR